LNQAAQESGQEALSIVNSVLQNNPRANMTYYEDIAREAQSHGHDELASRNRLLAEL
jgi:hypothetical protein